MNKKLTTLAVAFCTLTLAFASQWTIQLYTDEFGDEIQGEYFLGTKIEDASLVNSATSTGYAGIFFMIDSYDKIYISEYDYGFKNGRKEFFIDDYVYYSFKDDKGKVFSTYSPTSTFDGRLISEEDAFKVISMMINSNFLKVAIEGDGSKYTFKMDTVGFREKFVELCRKEYVPEGKIMAMVAGEQALKAYQKEEKRLEKERIKQEKEKLKMHDLSSDKSLDDDEKETAYRNKHCFTVRSYGLGLYSGLSKNKIYNENSFQGGLLFEYDYISNRNHAFNLALGFLTDGKTASFEETLGYGYRFILGKKIDLMPKVGLHIRGREDEQMVSKPSEVDGTQSNILALVGFNTSIQVNFHINEHFAITSGVGESFLFSTALEENCEVMPKHDFENLIEGFVGVTFML